MHSLSGNSLGAEGAAALAPALAANGALTSINLSGNNLTNYGRDMTGITELAAALVVNGALTSLDVRRNNIVGDGAVQLSAVVLGNFKIEMFNEIPIKEMRADSFTELDMNGKGIGVEGGMVVAELIPVMGALTECNVRGNNLDSESAKKLAMIGTEKGIMLFGIKRDQKEANFAGQHLGPADAILISSDLVIGSVTQISLAANQLEEEGTKVICGALEQNKTLKELDFSGDDYRSSIGGSSGAKHVAKMLSVTESLTQVLAF